MKKGFLLLAVMALFAMPKKTEAAFLQPTESVTECLQQRGLKYNLTGRISTIDGVKLVLNGKTGTLSYKMNGKRIVSKIVVDYEASSIDRDGVGYLVLKSYTQQGKLKGRFIGESDFAECGYLYTGSFVNVNGKSTDFLFCE